jgi:hypothetical protein
LINSGPSSSSADDDVYDGHDSTTASNHQTSRSTATAETNNTHHHNKSVNPLPSPSIVSQQPTVSKQSPNKVPKLQPEELI